MSRQSPTAIVRLVELATRRAHETATQEVVAEQLGLLSHSGVNDRIAKLNQRAKQKKNLDPTALQFLGRYSIEATAADTAARRLKLDRALTDWERNFLKR